MDKVLELFASGAKLIIALGLAYFAALWFALIVWTYRDIEQRTRSVITQIFATLLSVLFFVPGALLYLVLRPRDTLDEAFQRSLEEEYLLQDLEDLPRCHSCHRAIESDWVICPSCHTELRHECPTCAHLVRVTWDICPYCATELEPAASRRRGEQHRPADGDDPRAHRQSPADGGRPGRTGLCERAARATASADAGADPAVPAERPPAATGAVPARAPPERGEANRTEMLPARPVSPCRPTRTMSICRSNSAMRGTHRNDFGRNGVNGQHAENGRNGHAPDGNGYAPAPRDGTNDEAVAQRSRPSS